jgi:hypothetical protein
MNFHELELRDADFNITASLTVVIDGDETNLLQWTLEAGDVRECGVDRDYARQVYRACLALGFTVPEPDEEPYFNEEEAYEAAVDARMSAIYDAEPDWAV